MQIQKKTIHNLIRLDEGLVNIRNAIESVGDADVETWCMEFYTYLENTWLAGKCILVFQNTIVYPYFKKIPSFRSVSEGRVESVRHD